MRMKNFLTLGAALLLMAACNNADDNGTTNNNGNGGNGGGNPQPTEGISGEVEGVWEAGSVVRVTGHITVPEGKSLTIERGVTVLFDEAGVGVNHVAIEFSVDGNLYCLGTEEEPVRLTVDEALRTPDNTFAGLWGGIVAGKSCGEMLIDHTVIEYTGGQVIEGSPAAENGYYTAGDDAYPQITTNNVNGKYVITNSTLRNGWSDGIYMMGGQAIIADNLFVANGYDGAEAVNVKSGCRVDVARNVMYSPNTNGLKLSSSDQSAERGQAVINAYNNTILNSGWRRDGEKGGCIYVEENARVKVVNNLLVNCKFRTITPSLDQLGDPDGGYDRTNSTIDYNFYASGLEASTLYFEGSYDDDGETLYYSGVKYPYEGYNFDHEEYDTEYVDCHSKIARTADEASALNPRFVNYPIDSDPSLYAWDEGWDLHVEAGSPALEGTCPAGEVEPCFATEGLTVNGQLYTSPAVEAHFGAYGTK